jgi:hypothetical protein
MSVNNNTPYTDNSQIHTLIENILSTESPTTSFTGRELCHAKKEDVFAVGESAQKFPELLAGCTSSMVFLFCKRIISSAKRV